MFKIIRNLSIFSCVVLFTVSCKSSDDSDLFRAYVEGKMTLGPKSASNLMTSPIHLVSNNRIIGETFPKDNGQFVVAGPYTTGDYKLLFKSKIESFSGGNPQCKIDGDSLSIIIPSGVTYLIFNEIKFK